MSASYVAPLLLLLSLFLNFQLYPGFVSKLAPTRLKTQRYVRQVVKKETPSSTSASPTVKQAANELLSLLIERQQNGLIGDDKTKRINLLIDVLVEGKVFFDPYECLNPPLYVVCHQRGPVPLWSKLGIVRNDVQGQQYVYHESGEKSVINYAEIFGNALHLRAYGTYERDDPVENNNSDPSENRPLNGLFAALGNKKGDESSSSNNSTLACPADFVVTVTKGSVHVLSTVFDIPIAGTGFLRVLYADPRLRIFISPRDTSDDRWEKEGLVVVQVRSDLLEGLVEL